MVASDQVLGGYKYEGREESFWFFPRFKVGRAIVGDIVASLTMVRHEVNVVQRVAKGLGAGEGGEGSKKRERERERRRVQEIPGRGKADFGAGELRLRSSRVHSLFKGPVSGLLELLLLELLLRGCGCGCRRRGCRGDHGRVEAKAQVPACGQVNSRKGGRGI